MVTERKSPKYPIDSYAGRSIGAYTWFAFHAPSGKHFLRTTTFPEKWIRLTDAAWARDDLAFGVEHHWYDCPGYIADRTVNPHKPRTAKRRRRRSATDITKITKT